MSDVAAKLSYAKRWLEKNEAELLAELDGLMASCGLGDAAAVCAGWRPVMAKLPARFADPDGSKAAVIIRPMPLGDFGVMRLTAVGLQPEKLSKETADDISDFDCQIKQLDFSRWQLAVRDYERALAEAKAAVA